MPRLREAIPSETAERPHLFARLQAAGMAHGQEGSSMTEPTAQEWIKREQGLRSHYGLTLAEYEEMSAKQSGVCAICGEPPNWGTLQVDHNHATGRLRGLLCGRCNTAVGQYENSGARDALGRRRALKPSYPLYGAIATYLAGHAASPGTARFIKTVGTCVHCGEPFQPKFPGSRTCSSICRSQIREAQRQARNHRSRLRRAQTSVSF